MMQTNGTSGVNHAKVHRMNVIMFITLIVLLILSATWTIWIIFGGIDKLRELRIVVARHDLLKPTADYMYMLDMTKKIEAGLRTRLVVNSMVHDQKKRCTEDEFEAYTSLLYMYKRCHSINVVAFMANTSAESSWNKRAYSKSGARGLNQVMAETFDDANHRILMKYGKYDMYDVYHNTEAALATWIHNRNYLKSKLRRNPTIMELAWAYNDGVSDALRAIRSGQPNKTLDIETIQHGEKVIFYLEQYEAENYKVLWEEHIRNKE